MFMGDAALNLKPRRRRTWSIMLAAQNLPRATLLSNIALACKSVLGLPAASATCQQCRQPTAETQLPRGREARVAAEAQRGSQWRGAGGRTQLPPLVRPEHPGRVHRGPSVSACIPNKHLLASPLSPPARSCHVCVREHPAATTPEVAPWPSAAMGPWGGDQACAVQRVQNPPHSDS